ncbi:MAG: fumarate reductase/succinate dehydrogenase flavoprotein subunit [Desulfovibrio sp.]|jgi:succinate dehydrogenase/fumarate reductase flavoprotein subunit|nr:fumarate reductase/succinate dehydrogenase flavoprotein subunit [Desulfovibrio sp.]
MSQTIPFETITTDLLIIGGGTAGPMAGIKAKKKNPEADVLIVDKATVKRGGSICRGMDAYNNVTIPGEATVDEYVEAVDIISDGIQDKKVNRVLAENSFQMLKDLEEWGAAAFPRNEDGSFMVQQFHPKGKFLTEMRGDIKPVMAKLCKKLGVRTMDRTMATRVLTDAQGRATGATLLNVRTGECTLCKAKTVLICTGSNGRFNLPDTGFLFGSFDCPFNAGEGLSMVYEAGGELCNMEHHIFSPMIKDFEGPGHSTFTRYGAYLINAEGERFMLNYHEKGERAPSGIRGMAMRREVVEGRGPLYYDLRHLDAETVEIIKDGLFSCERPTEKEFFQNRNIDIGKDLIELTVSGPNICGGHGLAGVKVDETARTTVPNLYAAGDVASTCMGFVGAAWVFGSLAAEDAVSRLDEIQAPEVDEADARAEFQRLLAPLHRDEGLEAKEVEYKIRRMVKPYLASPKHGGRMESALRLVRQYRGEIDQIKVQDLHGVMKANEISSILDTVEMSLQASLFRTESRWGYGHYRSDFPEKSPEWDGCRVVVRKNADTNAMETVKETVA